MAAEDILTTKQRIKTLSALMGNISDIIKQCNNVQAYYESNSDPYRNIGVNSRMANIKAAIAEVANELDYLATDANSEFQFEWIVGTHDIGCIKFGDGDGTGSTDTITLKTGLAADNALNITTPWADAIATGDVIQVSGTTSNDGFYTVDSAMSPFIVSISLAAGSLVAEECVTSGAKVTKIRNYV